MTERPLIEFDPDWTPFDRATRMDRAPFFYRDNRLKDEQSGLVIPKAVDENLAWRAEIIGRCDKDLGFRQFIRHACANSLVLATNLFMWTKTFKDTLPDGRMVSTKWRDRPFVTWPVQDRVLCAIEDARREGENLAITKTRETGLSWLVTVAGACGLLFEDDRHFLYVSRKEEYVYRKGDHKALFTKILYNLQHANQPGWLNAGISDKELLIENAETGGSIEGESTNKDVGRGGRSDQAFIDESAAIERREEIDAAILDNAVSVVDVSTPSLGSYFNAMVAKKLVPIIELPWHECHEKVVGLRRDPTSPSGLTSNWRENQIKRARGNMKIVAQNVDMALGMAGDLVLDPDSIRRHIALNAVRPLYRGELVFAMDLETKRPTIQPEFLVEADRRLKSRAENFIRFHVDGRGVEAPPRHEWGDWLLWCRLERDRRTGLLRPPQDTIYGIGMDPGGGRGRNPGAIWVADLAARRLVARWVNATYGAKDQARIALAAALWFGGDRPAVICHETNGVGGTVTDMLAAKLKYPAIYRRRPTDRRRAKKEDQWGFHTSDQTKHGLIANFGDMLSANQEDEHGVSVPDRETLEQAQTFVQCEDGSVSMQAIAEKKKREREDHGDLVVAAALACEVVREMPRLMKYTGSRQEREARQNPLTQDGREELAAQQERRDRRERRWRA